jgi:hypothetical protein
MGLCNHSSRTTNHIARLCKETEYTLWLKHTKEYSLVNAYNMAVMATLAYSDVRTDKKPDRDVADFISKLANKHKLTVIKKENVPGITKVNPFIKEVCKGEGTDKEHSGYMIDKPTSTQAFWFADKENIVLAVRGTQEINQDMILASLMSGSNKAPDDAVIDLDGEQVDMAGITGQVHRGFKTQAETIIGNDSFDAFMGAASGKKLFIAGHSLGAAVATILAAYLKGKGFDPLLYTYGSPRVGNETFVKAYSDITHYRHVYHHDIVPLVPGRNLDMGIPELNLCAKAGLIAGGGLPLPTLVTLSSSLYLCSRNWSGTGYYHHGNLCQIIAAGHGSIMNPFEAHNIVSKRIRKLLKEKQDALKALERTKHERVDTDHSGISNPIEWWEHYDRLDDAKERAEKAKEALTHLPDDRKDDYSLTALLHGEVSDHFMAEGYLPFLAHEIQIEWELYKKNSCKETPLSRNTSSVLYARINRAIARCEKEIDEDTEAIKSIYDLGTINEQLSAGQLDRAQQTRNYIKMLQTMREKTKKDLARLQNMKQLKIGSFSLYKLRKSELELNLQLEKF